MNFKKITSSFLFILCCYFVSAQCPSCTPAFVGCKAAGGLCGSTPPGMANKPYTGSLNFFMPKKLNDPTTLSQCSGCSYVSLRHIKITGVGGLPIGMSYLFNKPNGTYKGYYDVENNDTLGCATFCGTPILAGVYPIKVFLLADVTAVGTPIGSVSRDDQSQVYLDTLVILPDTSGGVSSFTFGTQGKKDCDSLLVPFNAILSAPAPNPTSYSWNFGNGNTSTLKNPPAQLYTGKGVYTAKLTTTYYNYRVKKVFVNSTSGWSDVCDIACAGTPPDVYLDFSALGFNNKANEQAKCSSILFDNLNIIVPIGTSSTPLTIWDDDAAAIPVCGGDDNLGTHVLNINSGQYPLQVNFAGTNSSGYVEFDTVAGTQITDSIKIEIYGFPATPSVITLRDSICEGDSILLRVNPSYANATYTWFKNDTNVIVGADSAFYNSKAEAKYRVLVTDGVNGCAVTSLNKKVFFGTAAPAQVFIYFDQGTQKYFLNPFPVGFKAKWYFNGNEVIGETTQLLPDLGPGIYGAYEYNPSFTFCGVNAANDTVTVNGIFDSKSLEIASFSIYPNPNTGKFTVKANMASNQEVTLNITDLIGRQVLQKTILPINGEIKETLDLSDVNKGVYFVTLQSKTEKTNRKVVIE